MSEHTPGPWEAKATTFSKIEFEILSGKNPVAYISSGHLPDGQHVSNASLIAAAPDLLEALTLLEDAIDVAVGLLQQPEEHQQALAIEIQRRTDIAREAIAKATRP